MDKEQYAFTPSLELLRELRGLTAEEKLNWLEEANNFFLQFLTLEDIERYKRVRDGVEKRKE